jgi:RNA polymerase sigma-70 factor, ECF subfamily
VCFLAHPQGGFPAAGLHYALRKCAGKTVMPFRNSRLASGFQPDELSKTPEERRALDQLFSVTYEELRRLASSVKRSDPGATLSPTTMVNEAWVKLAKSPSFASTSRLHFKRIAARAMRQVLVEAARRRNASKRGGGEGFAVITFDESQGPAMSCGQDLLALDSALEELARIQPRQAMMVESRFFGGLDINEIAVLLAVSEATILRDWRAAKAWLAHELRRAS